MDWLEYHSPMLIDWPHRCMQIENNGYTIILQGVAAKSSSCAQLSSVQLDSVHKNSAVAFTVQLCFTTDASQQVTMQVQELPAAVT